MGIIRTLSLHEIQKIAAGEVIERPAHIVKELLENALDAGATDIVLFIENSGKKSIRIRDNGCGMSEEDTLMSVMHHATSKITSVHDLETLQTFGFRGEALSSIAAVSRLHIHTATSSHDGFYAAFHYGILEEHGVKPCNKGTDITISGLFEHMPARKKFLRSDTTEWNTIVQFIQAMALSHQACAFRVFHNDTMIFDCSGSQTLEERVHTLFGFQLSNSLRSFSQEKGTIIGSGVITGPHYQRYDRHYMYFFVNGRWVKNVKLFQALMKAYTHVLPAGRYPAGVISLSLPCEEVDINVHPRKEEVAFLYPRMVERFITESISHALEGCHEKETSLVSPASPLQKNTMSRPMNYYSSSQEMIAFDHHEKQSAIQEDYYRIVMQYAFTYIFIEDKNSLIVLDQHAVHERILYEELFQSTSVVESINLLFPSIITIPLDYQVLLTEHQELFEKHGIHIEQCGDSLWALKALPVILKHQQGDRLILDLLDQLYREEKNDLHHVVRAMVACKAAVKSGDVLSEQEMRDLIKKWKVCPRKFTCPHGRPTVWELPLSELAKKFKRFIG